MTPIYILIGIGAIIVLIEIIEVIIKFININRKNFIIKSGIISRAPKKITKFKKKK